MRIICCSVVYHWDILQCPLLQHFHSDWYSKDLLSRPKTQSLDDTQHLLSAWSTILDQKTCFRSFFLGFRTLFRRPDGCIMVTVDQSCVICYRHTYLNNHKTDNMLVWIFLFSSLLPFHFKHLQGHLYRSSAEVSVSLCSSLSSFD